MITKDQVYAESVRYVTDLKLHYRTLRKDANYEQLWKDCETTYYNGTNGYYEGKAKFSVSELHNHVERIVPKLSKSLFPPDGNYIALAPPDSENNVLQEDADAAQALLKRQFKDIHVASKMVNVERDCCIYGTSFIKVYWEHIEKMIYKRVNGEREAVYEIVYDNPNFYCPSIWDIYADPSDEDLQGNVIEELIVNYSDLWQNRIKEDEETGEEEGIYEEDELLKLKEIKVTNRNSPEEQNKGNDIKGGNSNQRYSQHEHKLRALEFWGKIPKWFLTLEEDDKETGEMIDGNIVLCGDDGNWCPIKIDDNPFDHQRKPYLRVRYIKLNGKLYGYGVISPVTIPREAELCTLRQQLMDMRTFMLKRKWIIDKNAEILKSQLQDINNLVIEANDINGIKDIQQQDFSASGIQNIREIKSDMQEGTGASPLLGSGTGTGGSLDRTSGGVAAVMSSGLDRFELVALGFESEIMIPMTEMFWALNQQFLPEGRDVQLTGKGIRKVSPDQIPFHFDINFLGLREIGEREFKINSLNILIQNLEKFVPLGLDPIPVILKMIKLMGMGELITEIDKRPEAQLEFTPEGELKLLQAGRKITVNLDDNHDLYIPVYTQLLQQPNLPDNVMHNTKVALIQRLVAKKMLQSTMTSEQILAQFQSESEVSG